jgi:septum site-determining protein MinC
MTDNILKSQAFKLKGRLFTFTVLQLIEVDKSLFIQQLREMILQAPRLFENTPIVLDCTSVDGDALDLSWVHEHMRNQGLFPVAIQASGHLALQTIARGLGLAVLHASSEHDKPVFIEQPIAGGESSKTKRIATPIRSGQQVVSKGTDLIVTASVSHGAELLAEGNIHVYGALRGKALAGISGDKDARIYCQSLDAELVSIAGFYRLRDTMDHYEHPCQIFLHDDQIQIEPL